MAITQPQVDAWTVQLATLRDAMATGAQSVSYDGQTVTYRSYADMRKAEADLVSRIEQGQLEVDGDTVVNPRPRVSTINLGGW